MKNLNEQKQKNLKDKNINKEKNNCQDNFDIIDKIKEIFNHFSNNSKYLSNNNFKLFLIESSLLDDFKITPEYSNILFYSFSSAKNCISFQSFCKLIIKIASIKFPDKFKENQENALFLLYEVYLKPLTKIYHVLNTENNNKSEKKDDNIFKNINNKLIIQKIVSRITKEIIEKNYLLFLKIYQKYFCFENLKISNSQKNHLSQKAFDKVLYDFNISPSYINSELTGKIFNLIMNNKDFIINIMNNFINIKICNNDGMWFTLFHFIIGLYLTSIMSIVIKNYDKNEPDNIYEIFLNNNDSKAFENFLLLFYKSTNIKTVMDEEIKKIQFEILNKEIDNEDDKIDISFNNDISPILKKSHKSEFNSKESLNYSEMIPIILNKYKKQLISIYRYYSELFFETNFSVYMTQNGFISLIKDMNLLLNKEDIPKNYKNMPPHQKFLLESKYINFISFNAINIIFSKFSSIQSQKNKSSNQKINFIDFINSILIFANKIYNPKFNKISFDDKLFSYDELINSKCQIKYGFNFINEYLNPLYSNISSNLEEANFTMDNLMIILKNEKLKYIANKIIPIFIRILKFYNDNKEYIEYFQYYKCLNEFNIFPDFVQRKKMIKIFINFIKDFDNTYLLKGNNKVVSEVKSCAYGILLIGLDIEDSGDIKSNDLEIKLFNYIHKIAQSENLGKISIINIKNNLQKDFLKSLNEIHDYLFNDKNI